MNESEEPDGWASSRIDQVCKRITDGTHHSPKEQSRHGAYMYITAKNIREWGLDLSDVTFVPEVVHRPIFQRCNPEEGDVLYIKDGATAGIAIVNPVADEFSLLSSVALLKPDRSKVDPSFLKWYLMSPVGRKAMLDQVTGSAITRLTLEIIRNSTMPLPPLAEQKRIVAKVEELLASVNAARDRLARVPAILKRLRQAILAAACEGRLTEAWRDSRPGDATTAEASTEGLPTAWRWIDLPKAGFLGRGTSRHRPRNAPELYGGLYPFIQTGDIARSGGRVTEYRQTYNDAGLAQSRLWPTGTVCITIAANIADSGILSYPACFPDSVVGFIANDDVCISTFVEYFIRTARADLSQFAPATAQRNINIAILNDVQIPLPPVAEQREIVRHVEALFALADAIEKRVTVTRARAESLQKAILMNAFSGAIV